MAYMNKDKKAAIAAELKTFMPKSWKYSLRVENYSTLVMTVQSAPVDLNDLKGYGVYNRGYHQVNEYYIDSSTDNVELKSLLTKIVKALNLNNHDNSDLQTDYFDVGHYIDLKFGTFEKNFISTL